MNLVDVGAKTSGSTLNMVAQTFDTMFGQGNGKLNLGANGTNNPQVRNVLNVTDGILNLTDSSNSTGSLVSGEGLINANSLGMQGNRNFRQQVSCPLGTMPAISHSAQIPWFLRADWL